MDAEEIKKRTREFIDEVFNRKNIGFARETLAEDFVEHQPPPPGISADKKGALQFFEMMASAFPDMKVDIKEMLVDGDKVVILGGYRGTHQGEFMGIPATGKPVAIESIDIVRVADDGLTHEHWGVQDTMGMMMQLGVVPAPE